jgi:hypothetical protein
MKEVHICPEEWQERLRFLGGENRYGEPHFKLGWAQYETFRSGGCWSVGEAYFEGYRDILAGSGEPCWTLFQWHSPEEYNSPEAYYIQNFDDATGLQILGGYPYSGRYEVVYNLRWNEIVNGKIEFYTLPLNTTTFDLIIPIIIAAKNVSIEKRRTAYLDAKQKEEDAMTLEIEKHLKDRDIPFKEAVSYTRQGVRSPIVDQKMLQLRSQWGELAKAAKQFKLGLQTR